jgi:hypothetical protein
MSVDMEEGDVYFHNGTYTMMIGTEWQVAGGR